MEKIALASIADSLYEQDYYAWTEQQVALLQAERLAEIDIAHLVEEIEDMGRSQRRAVKSALLVVLIHLLKYRFQPTHRTQSWRATLREHRRRLRDEFADSPSLEPYAERVFAECYQDACEDAADETGLPLATFPPVCPFTLEHVLDRNFLPD
ncbi:MAG: DUF29 domain-containing protein [Gammaproteobacteria bacterium]